MGHGHVITHNRGKTIPRDMKDAAILDIAAFSNSDVKDIPANDRIKPDTGMITDFDIPDNLGSFLDKNTFANFWKLSQIASDHFLFVCGEFKVSEISGDCTWNK